MKLRIVSTFVVVTVVSAWAGACGTVQPKTQCITGHGPYAVKYTLKPGQTVTGPCAEKKGEIVGIQKYSNPADPSNQTIAIKTETLTGLSDGAHDGRADLEIIALGKLNGGDSNEQNYCVAPTFPTVRDVDGGTDTAYTFSNVQFYTTAQIPGTQFQGEVAYTEGGCTANYTFVGVYPAVDCTGNNGQPDVSLCAQSGENGALNPDFAVTCELVTGENDPDPVALCVPASTTLPSLKPRNR